MKTVLKERSTINTELQHRRLRLKWKKRRRWESCLMTPCEPEMLPRAGRYPWDAPTCRTVHLRCSHAQDVTPEMLPRSGRYPWDAPTRRTVPASVKSRIFYAVFLFRICVKRIAATYHKNAIKQRMEICVRQYTTGTAPYSLLRNRLDFTLRLLLLRKSIIYRYR